MQQYLNNIIILKFKYFEKILKFLWQNFKNIEKFIAKFEKQF